jgi:ADP-heptose:LPS heptosyltransferase
MAPTPRRIVLLKPCCIGDVIFATPLLMALRRAYPAVQIDWAVGSMAISALRGHPAIDHLIDTGSLANPASRPLSLARLVRRLRGYDLAVVPDRSRLYSLATLLAGIPRRAGLDSAGRGLAYNIAAPIDPSEIRHEAEIYLDVGRALGLDVSNCWASVPPTAEALAAADSILGEHGLAGKPPILVHPGGGVNAGMTLIEKRWPPERFAALADRLAEALGTAVVMLGLESDRPALDAFRAAFKRPLVDLSNRLSLAVTGALASRAALYLGNDNGVAHLAAASGGKVLMIFGPSDPRRYAPFVPPDRARFAWRPIDLPSGGVSAGAPLHFDWARDGVGVDEAWEQASALLGIA